MSRPLYYLHPCCRWAVLVLFLSACSLPESSTSTGQATASVDNCPSPVEELPAETVQWQRDGSTYVFRRFDYAPRTIALEPDTIRFSAREYDFVYCRANQSWTVQPGTLGNEAVAQLDAWPYLEAEFSTLDWNGQAYRYRVVREPDRPEAPQEQAVVLELIRPNQETPQRYPLYTLGQLAEASGVTDIGFGTLGVPRITSAQIYGDRLWWTVAFEQGEGNNGIATIVSYEPQADDLQLIQPPEIWSQQILDLTFTGDEAQPTLWMGVRVSQEGIRDVPASGLVAYRPDSADLTSGQLESYTPYNSPLIGYIPSQIAVDGEHLWIGTRNGVCQLAWQAPAQAESWNCWQFMAQATPDPDGEPIAIYPSLQSQTPVLSRSPEDSTEPLEVLWWMLSDPEPSPEAQQGRYEVRLEEGLVAMLEQGASPILEPQWIEIAGKVPLFWPGYWWYWQGDRFVRPLDGYLNQQISGDRGIGESQDAIFPDWYALRGDLDLLELSAESTRVRYYSGWVEDTQLTPVPTVVQRSLPEDRQTNPLIAIDQQLRQQPPSSPTP